MIFFMIMFILEGSAVFGIQIWSIWWMNLVLYNAMNWRNGRIFAANASEKRLDSGANWFFLYSNERSSFKPQTFCKLIWWELLINASPTYQNWFKSGTNFHGDVLSYFLCTFFGVLSLYSNLTSWISLDPPRDPPSPSQQPDGTRVSSSARHLECWELASLVSGNPIPRTQLIRFFGGVALPFYGSNLPNIWVIFGF